MICLKCGYQICFGPGGCGCTQKRRQDLAIENSIRVGKKLMEIFKKKKKSPKSKTEKKRSHGT